MKKQYEAPSTRVVELELQSMIATSSVSISHDGITDQNDVYTRPEVEDDSKSSLGGLWDED